MGKHSSQAARRSVTKAALVGGAAATAAAMTVGMAAPSANAASTVSNSAVSSVSTQVGQTAADTIGGFFQVPVHLGTGLAESSLRAGIAVIGQPVNFLTLADAIATGNREELFGLIENAVDAPLWIADPTIDALQKAFPQYADRIESFRDDVLWRLTEVVNAAIKPIVVGQPAVSTLAQTAAASNDPLGDAIDAFVGVAKGLGQSGINAVEGSLLAPVSVVLLAAAVVQGKDAEAKYLVQQMIDAPLWIAKPTLDALADPKVPAPIGGEDGLAARVFDQAYNVRQTVRKLVLGTDANLPKPGSQQTATSSDPETVVANRSFVSSQSAMNNGDGESVKPGLPGASSLPKIDTRPQQGTPQASSKVDPFSIVRGSSNSPQVSQDGTTSTTGNLATNVPGQLQNAAQNAQSGLRNAADNVRDQIANAANQATGAFGKRQQSNSPSNPSVSTGTGTSSNK